MTESTNQVSASSFSFEKILITSQDDGGDTYDITELVYGLTYYEDITKGYVSANMRVIDAGQNIKSSLPIQGFEPVEITVNGPDEEQYEMKLYVYLISDVSSTGGKQSYNLGLISKEGLLNEQIKISKRYDGTPTTIVRNILKDSFDTEDIIADDTLNKTVVVPNNRSPFTVCSMIADRSMTDGNTAGCFFFMNANGFNFRSIDTLCDVAATGSGDGRIVKVFRDSMNANQTMDPSNIISVTFLSEVNLMEGLRLGAYSGELQLFNIDTGEVSTETFKVSDNWDNQKHLGTQDQFSTAMEMAIDSPTRINSAIVSNENFYSGKKAAKDDAEYKDWTGKILQQSFSRNYILNTQGLRIEVPGNLDVVVGDRVRVILQNAVSENQREEEDIDTVNSGFYLVTKLSRFYNKTNYNVTTVLKLQRDTYGSEADNNNQVLLE